MDALIKAIRHQANRSWTDHYYNVKYPIRRRLDMWLWDILRGYSEENGHRYLSGIQGIKFLFDCEYSTAQKIKKTIIKDAIIQEAPGKPFKFDYQLAAELYEKYQQTKK